ncbi:MAG: TIM44-like domain-containing protein [Pseudolabrys sp.]
MIRFRSIFALAAMILAVVFVAADAQARVGGGFSGGSRGSRTFSAPPATRTAPNAASPIQRSITQPGAPSSTFGGAPFARPGFFGSGLFGGLAAGFLGAGLFGLLFGHGLFGGMSGFGSFFGLALQLLLVFFLARLAMRWWQSRSAPAFAGPAASRTENKYENLAHPYENARTGFGANAPSGEPLSISKSDFDDFERLLNEIQMAYGAEDLARLRQMVTPEMASYFAEDLAANTSRGQISRISAVKLLQGDLAEAWREGAADYATVDMRFSLDDRMVDRASGREIGGGPQEVTEVWTFMRTQGGAWLLSAIQQA